MRVLIDADGCPVVDITVKTTAKNNIECIILCDTSHSIKRAGAKTITVSKGADSVDFALVNMVQKGDIVVTQDYGLAAICLARGARVINQDGMIYDNDNIDGLLMKRHTARKIRMSGGRTRGNPKRTQAQGIKFEEGLKNLITNYGICTTVKSR